MTEENGLVRRGHTSVINVTIGGETYPLKHNDNCKVCTSPYRLEIERALVGGLSYKAVIDGVIEGRDHEGDPPEASDLRSHLQGQHLPLPDIQKRAIIERRAKEIGRTIEEGQDMLVDYAGVNELIIQRGMERISSKEISPDMPELMAALNLQHKIESSRESAISDEVWFEAINEYMILAREVMPPEVWEAFGERLESSPILQALAEKIRKAQAQAELEG